MISSRIVDNDWGAVMKVPLNGVGTVFGVTISVDKLELKQYDVNLLEMLLPETGLRRFTEFVDTHLPDADSKLKEEFISQFKTYVKNKRSDIVRGYQ